MWPRPKNNTDDAAPSRRRRPLRALRRAVSTLLALAAILYVSALAASRTAGFRGLAAARLGEWLEGEVQIGAAALTPRLALRLDRIVWGRPDTPGAAALRVESLWLQPDWPWRPGRLRSATVRGVSVAFAESAEYGWQPARLAAVAGGFESWLGDDLLNVRAVAAPAAPPAAPSAESPARTSPPRRLRLTLRDAEAAWWNAAGERVARIEGLQLDLTPVSLPGREMWHIRAAVARIESERGICAERIRVEFLDTERQRLLLDFDTGLDCAGN